MSPLKGKHGFVDRMITPRTESVMSAPSDISQHYLHYQCML